jgi:hypothetical protein
MVQGAMDAQLDSVDGAVPTAWPAEAFVPAGVEGGTVTLQATAPQRSRPALNPVPAETN